MKKIFNKIIRLVFNFLHYLRKWYWRTFKIETRGVRVILSRNGLREVILVYHRYGDLWVLPGGGIHKNENLYDAGRREVKEELNINILEFEEGYLGVYSNSAEGKNDTVYVLMAKSWQEFEWKPNLEIENKDWYSSEHLPENASGATKRRIFEWLGGDWNMPSRPW
jgi:8-oxo-dGTP pyrophosphatase MutT (NUDIX family)